MYNLAQTATKMCETVPCGHLKTDYFHMKNYLFIALFIYVTTAAAQVKQVVSINTFALTRSTIEMQYQRRIYKGIWGGGIVGYAIGTDRRRSSIENLAFFNQRGPIVGGCISGTVTDRKNREAAYVQVNVVYTAFKHENKVEIPNYYGTYKSTLTTSASAYGINAALGTYIYLSDRLSISPELRIGTARVNFDNEKQDVGRVPYFGRYKNINERVYAQLGLLMGYYF